MRTSTPIATGILSLPEEVLQRVLLCLGPEDMCAAVLVS